jgi:hypothetical protein
MTGQKQYLKFVVFVPVTHTETVLQAMAGAGAGRIGDYDSCSFTLRGTGRFRPLEGAVPFIGEKGKVESVEEDRVEVVVPLERMRDVLRATREAHPYEEMAHDIYPLLNHEYME